MPLSVRLDARTDALIGRLARKRRQTKSEVIRDAIGALAKQEEQGCREKTSLRLGRPSDWLRGQRRCESIPKHR
jgi:Arc/MetJ-type ribon-helix-helix transcriptional regulator